MIRMVSCAIAMAIALASARADGTEIKVISAGAVRGLVAEMIADYARETGDRFDFKIGTTGQLRTIIASGQPADLIIASATLMAELEASGKMISGTGVELGRVGIGIAVRDGAPVADVASVQGFKQALIEARSVAYSDPRQGGASGVYFVGVLDRLGLADTIAQKALLTNGGRAAVEKVARGEADLAVTLISEIVAVKGVRLAAAVPEPLQIYSIYAAGIPASSSNPLAARAFIAALTAPSMAERWKAAGFEPPR
jgi:molybdate transport system substrate-binding protein